MFVGTDDGGPLEEDEPVVILTVEGSGVAVDLAGLEAQVVELAEVASQVGRDRVLGGE